MNNSYQSHFNIEIAWERDGWLCGEEGQNVEAYTAHCIETKMIIIHCMKIIFYP